MLQTIVIQSEFATGEYGLWLDWCMEDEWKLDGWKLDGWTDG